MGKRGPKKRYTTPEQLAIGIEEFFAQREKVNQFPDLPGMRIHLGISQEDLEKMCNGNTPEARKCRALLEAAKDKRTSWLVRRMVAEPKTAQGCQNALKQPENGGYIDRPVADSGDKTLTINLIGIPGGENAFK